MLRFTLIADVKSRYGDVDISVHSPLCPWLLRHAQWLINRYLQKSAGLTAYERRWNRKYHGSICNCGETLTLRVANVGKTQLSWRDGIWLGRDTESHMHCVAVSSGVFKTPGVSGRTSRQDNRAWNFCKASQPHLGIPLVPSVKQMLSYFQFPRTILSHCRRERPRKTLLQKSLWTIT